MLVLLSLALVAPIQRAGEPRFELVQPELFGEAGSLTNAWADFDNDGDFDLFVGFNSTPNRLYRNDAGTFVDVAAEVGLADPESTRAAAWGDYDGDGHLDLYVGFSGADVPNRLYRNDGDGRRFTDVATTAAAVLPLGATRQVSWIDYDNDGDLDLSVAFRNLPNALLRNDGGTFTEAGDALGIADPRRTVGAVWFDVDQDGDLDQYVANMDGDANGLFRNDGERFVDVAAELGLEAGGRALGERAYGSVRPNIADYDRDGDLDIFLANYGPNGLLRNDGDGGFTNVAAASGLAIESRYDSGAWGDWDNDGLPDLYVNGTIGGGTTYRDYLFRNEGAGFTDVTPALLLAQNADHGVQWADFDGDGDLDLALTGSGAEGMTHLLRNLLAPERARRSVQVLVLDDKGHYTRAGAEVRLYAAGTRDLLGMGIVDTGSGYDAQNALPVHLGAPGEGRVDVEVTFLTPRGRAVVTVADVDPAAEAGRPVVVREPAAGAPGGPVVATSFGPGAAERRGRNGTEAVASSPSVTPAGVNANWPQWRGPGGRGIAAGSYPDTWSAGEGIVWKTEIPGRGHSSPVVWGDRVFLTTSIEGAHIPGRIAPDHLGFDLQPGYLHPDSVGVDYAHTLVVLAIDAADGTILWERPVHDGPVYDNRHRKNTYASATVVTDGELVYASFESEGLYAFDMDGNLRWEVSFGGMAKAGLGPGTSPILFGDLLILQGDQEMGAGSFIAALDRATGEPVWRNERSNRRSWATPLLVQAGGRTELLASGAEAVIAYDPATGAELWRTDGTRSHPIPSIVAASGLAFATAGSQAKVALAIRTGPGGDEDRVVWRYNKGTAYVPSPILYRGYLYLLSDRGIVTCLDAETGAVVYEGGRVPVPATFTASPVAFDDKILLTSEDGDTFVLRAGPRHEIIRTNSLGEPVYASAALAGGRIYIRGARHLFAIE
jgi:outer membrane protein assembly factor BamB